MTIIFTRKFSQFVPQPVTSVVGLTSGANSIGPNSGGGGGGVTAEIVQPNAFVPGQWLRVDDTGTYQLAEANDAQDGEAIGVVIAATPTEFTLQQAGYIFPTQNVFNAYFPLGQGQVYFLDPANPGGMIAQDPTQNGQITRPLFVAATTGGGWVLPYRPLIVGGEAPIGPNTDANFVTVTQLGNTFVVGNWVRVDTDNTTGPVHYTLAQADILANAQCVGVVVNILVPGSQFVIQFSGYNIGSVTQDDALNPLISSSVYYLSATVAGAITSIDPGLIGLISKPLYISEQTTMFAQGLDNGYILPQRPILDSFPNPNIVLITQAGHGFVPGNWIRTDGANPAVPYVLGQADTLANAEVCGVVIKVIDVNNFVMQEVGYLGTGVVTANQGTVYYLDPVNPGQMIAGPPVVVGQVIKPLFTGDNTAAGTGWILPQLPTVITAANNAVITTITQTGHGFTAGDWVRTQNVVGSQYTKALGDNLVDSWVVGLVIQVLSPNSFVLQECGYIAGIFGGALIAGTIYYLSTTVMGGQQNTAPVSIGQSNRPVFSADTTNSGWILPHRPEIITAAGTSTSIIPVNQPGHGFKPGQFVAVAAGTNIYVLAIASSMVNAYVGTGFVIDVVDVNNFVLQQSGYTQVFGTVVPPFTPALTGGNTYFLSPTVPGAIQLAEPLGAAAVSRPVLNSTDTGSGWILPQRPILNAGGGGGGGGGLILITTVTATGATINLPNIFNGTYSDIKIVGRNLRIGPSNYGFKIQWYYNGVLNVGYYQRASGASEASGSISQYSNGVTLFYSLDGNAAPGTPHQCNAQAGFAMMFDSEMYGINSTQTVKTAFTRFLLPNAGYYVQQGANQYDYYGSSSTTCYGNGTSPFGTAASQPITGILITTYSGTFVGGTISIYGTAS